MKKLKPRKTKIDAVPDEKIAEALRACEGRQMHAADYLGVSGAMICQRIKVSPYLQQVVHECREKRLDDAEAVLARLNKADNLGSACFVLKTLGKHRGYTEQTIVSAPQELYDQMRAMSEEIRRAREEKKRS